MRAFNTIEQRALARGDMLNLTVHPRNIDYFKLCYTNPACAWEIRLRQVRDDIQWQISEAPSSNFPILPREESRSGREQQGLSQPQNQNRDEKFLEAVRKHFWGAGEGWCGLMTMINTTTWDGVEEALGKTLPRLPERVYFHIDLDVLDGAEASVNEYSSSGGLTVPELLHVIRFVGHNRGIVGASITAYDPSVDHDSRAVRAAVAAINELLAAACIDIS